MTPTMRAWLEEQYVYFVKRIEKYNTSREKCIRRMKSQAKQAKGYRAKIEHDSKLLNDINSLLSTENWEV
jgi:tRNA U54 and U55 pseudouridine synthase Pus10